MGGLFCSVLDHDWGNWGKGKANDKGTYLQYRRCQRCDQLEERPGEDGNNYYFTPIFSSRYPSKPRPQGVLKP